MALPEVRAVGTVASNAAAISPGLPSGTVAGDLLVMVAESQGAGSALTASGWTSLFSIVEENTRLTVLYKVAAGSDATTTNDTGDHQVARIVGIKKGTYNAADPIHKSAEGKQAATKSVVIPGLTTTLADCLILGFASGSLPDASSTTQFGAATNASLGSLTERIDNAVTAGDGGAIYCVSGTKATAGEVSTTTLTAVTEAPRGVASIAIASIPSTARKNLFYNPRVASATDFAGGGQFEKNDKSEAKNKRVEDTDFETDFCFQTIIDVSNGDTRYLRLDGGDTKANFAVGKTYVLSCWIKQSSSELGSLEVSPGELSGVELIEALEVSNSAISTYQRISTKFKVKEAQAYFFVEISGSPSATGTIKVGDVVWEEATEAGAFFPTAAQITAKEAWFEGATDNSPSFGVLAATETQPRRLTLLGVGS